MARQKGNGQDGVRLMGWARLWIGGLFLLAPGLSVKQWIGEEDGVASRAPARALGAREVALGIGTLLAEGRQAPVRGWMEAGVVCDSADAVISMFFCRGVSIPRRILFAVPAAAAALYGAKVASSVR